MPDPVQISSVDAQRFIRTAAARDGNPDQVSIAELDAEISDRYVAGFREVIPGSGDRPADLLREADQQQIMLYLNKLRLLVARDPSGRTSVPLGDAFKKMDGLQTPTLRNPQLR